MYIIITLGIVIGLSSSSFAELKYNPYTGQWENVGSSYKMKYNPYSGNFGYQKPKAELKYNPYTGQWEYER